MDIAIEAESYIQSLLLKEQGYSSKEVMFEGPKSETLYELAGSDIKYFARSPQNAGNYQHCLSV